MEIEHAVQDTHASGVTERTGTQFSAPSACARHLPRAPNMLKPRQIHRKTGRQEGWTQKIPKTSRPFRLPVQILRGNQLDHCSRRRFRSAARRSVEGKGLHEAFA